MQNRAADMEIFTEVAGAGSFSEAGRRLNLSPSAVSKAISRLESRLGTRLLVRSTRALHLTPEGDAYLLQSRRILSQIEEAERAIADGGGVTPRGRLRVNSTVGFGEICLLPLVPAFLAQYPEVQLDLSLNDGVVDLIEERADIAIRVGTALRDSPLKARKLAQSRRVVIAAPTYLERHGIPQTPEDLVRHNCLGFNFRTHQAWPFRAADGRTEMTTISGNFLASSGSIASQMAIAGLGLARVGEFHVRGDIDAGRLVPVLEAFNPEDIEIVHAVYTGHDHLAARIRAFIDFMAARLAN
jgi:DNA-binding transcriptional LysR family regulator